MSIDFHAPRNRYAYSNRRAAREWADTIRSLIDPAGQRVADIGCGGGIYSIEWARLGARSVVGVDFSEQMVIAARENAAEHAQLEFRRGDAQATGLPAHSVDVVFERALIHHLEHYDACFAEAARLLVPGGALLIQDRTPDDVQAAGSPEHIRAYFFECFPRLRAVEAGRRPRDERVRLALREAGFDQVEARTFWETRRVYADFGALADDLRARSGRSILHELSDAELETLIAYIGPRVGRSGPIREKDRWTLWLARNGAASANGGA